MRNRPWHSRLQDLLVSLLLLVLLAATLWYSGAVGLAAGPALSRWVLPLRFADIEITKLTGAGHVPELSRGVVVSVGAQRATQIVRDAWRHGWLLPPGLVRPGAVLHAAWLPRSVVLPDGPRLPLKVVINDDHTEQLRLVLRYPARHMNNMLAQLYSDKWSKKREWFLGSYDVSHQIFFKELSLVSAEQELPRTIKRRQVRFEAEGRVRFRLEENLAAARVTAEVADLTGTVDLDVLRDHRGIGVSYHVNIDELRGKVPNLAPWADKMLSERLRASLSRSANKARKKAAIARKRIPHWAPVDIRLDLQFTP